MTEVCIKNSDRPPADELLQTIADYILEAEISSTLANTTAAYCLFDTLACGLMALDYQACTKLLGPIVPNASLSGGARVPGTNFELDPVRAAYNIGVMNRWLDFNDTWLAAEWGHPSDNLGGILAVADYISRQANNMGNSPLTMQDVLQAMIKAYEIQGGLALENSLNQVGLDHVLFVRVATAAVVTDMLGGTREQIMNVLSNAFIDGGALRTYRHAPNTGSRKSWAAGDATSRGVWLALNILRGEMGYPSALTAKTWGFQDVVFNGNSLKLNMDLGSYVMENVLFKISYPAEFHAQTAVEAAIKLHPEVKHRLGEIEKINIETQKSAIRIIDKTGLLNNPADRDHCLQYMVAVALIKGGLQAEDYEDSAASDSNLDMLREKMHVVENSRFSQEYLEADKRAIGNAIQIYFNDGTATNRVLIDYPVGHKRRREEGIPLLLEKFRKSLQGKIVAEKSQKILQLCEDHEQLKSMQVPEFMDLFVV